MRALHFFGSKNVNIYNTNIPMHIFFECHTKQLAFFWKGGQASDLLG